MKSKKYSYRRISLKIKFLMAILPVIICSIIVSSYHSNLLYKRSLIQAGIDFKSYKAQQLIKYSDLQWDFIFSNKLSENDEYIKTVKETIKIYAENMISKKGEIIFAVNSDGQIDFSTSEITISEKERDNIIIYHKSGVSGWNDILLSEVMRTGLHFHYIPFNWHVFILQDYDSFFSAVSLINRQQIIVVFISLMISVFLIIYFVRIMTKSLNKAADNVSGFVDMESDFRHLDIDFPDEIGELAYEFNIMSLKLKKSFYDLKTAAEHEKKAKRQVIEREIETLQVLGTASDYRDPETGEHITRVSYYSKLLAACLGETEYSQDLIFRASPLHDLGKLGIPDSMLLKPGRLTEDEFEIIKTHPEIGYNILKNTASWYLRAGSEIALTHHERYDGSGYPHGIQGHDIPLFGRITAVADVFDALTSKRPYKDPWPLERAFEFIESESEKSFDPEIVFLFLENREKVESIFYKYRDS